MVYKMNATPRNAFRTAVSPFYRVETSTKLWNISTNGAQR